MREEKIGALLSDEEGTIPVSIRMPKILVDRLAASYRKKVGAVKSRGITSQSVLYFAARGLIDWEDEHREDGDRKKSLRQSSEG